MSATALGRRVVALENSAPVIDDLADFVRWHAEGSPSNRRWDPRFEKQMEELAEKSSSIQQSVPDLCAFSSRR